MVNNGFADEKLTGELEQSSEWWSELPVSSLKLTRVHTILPDVSVGKVSHVTCVYTCACVCVCVCE